MKVDPNSDEGKRIKERRDALLQAMDEGQPVGSVREVILLKDGRGEVIMQVTRWKKPARGQKGWKASQIADLKAKLAAAMTGT